MTVNKDELEFHKLLNLLADQCEFKLTELVIEIYDDALRPYGYEKVNYAIRDIFKVRRGKDKFPSIGDILDAMGLTISPRSVAVDASSKIFWAFAQWKLDFIADPNFQENAEEKLGQVPWETIVRMGGYRALYKEWNESSDLAILRAQVRDAAMALIELKAVDQKLKMISIEGKILIKGGTDEP